MNILQVIVMEKDRGYAWVILGASTILMFIGPSTFTSMGFLLADVKTTPKVQEWILNVFYLFWVLSAFLAACFAKQRPRQLATTGTLLASVGFISSASSVKDPTWLYLTFSMAVGFGLGLSLHTAYLVVMNNFDRHKGLVNGVCTFFIALGQIITPILFSAVSMPRDRFQVKSLTTAVGFLTTLFFVVPAPPPSRRATIVGDRNRRYSTTSRTSRRGSLGEAAVPLHTGFVPTTSNSIPINQARTRRRSQYLLQVSTSLLPNIPEEPESTHSTNDTLTSASSDSDVSCILPQGSTSISINSSNKKDPNGNKPIVKDDSSKIVNENEKENKIIKRPEGGITAPGTNLHVPLRRLSEGSVPSSPTNLLSNDTKQIASNTNGTQVKNTAPRFRRFSESQLESSKKQAQAQSRLQGPAPLAVSKSHQDLQSSSLSNTNLKSSSQEKEAVPASKRRPVKGESIIDFSLLRDFHFLNMAVFSCLCTVTVVSYPILFYNYVQTRCADKEKCIHQANVALTIISIVDLISRLLFSYLSDLGILSRRMGFLIACGIAGIIIAATPLTEEVVSIYFISVIYGLCSGMFAACQYLMFIESFGFEKFSQAYGLLHIIKLLVVILIGIPHVNPLTIYLYPIRPFGEPLGANNNHTLFDPMKLHKDGTISEESASVVRLLIEVAIPSILCALAWITEDIFNATQKCYSVPTNTKSQTGSTTNTSSDVP